MKRFFKDMQRYINIVRGDILSYCISWIVGYFPKAPKRRPRLLIYKVNGLAYGGTEKGLQFIAENVDKKKFDVYFMHGDSCSLFGGIATADLEQKKKELQAAGVILIRMDFERQLGPPSHALIGANPSPVNVAKTLGIDLFITANMGYADYPIPLLPCPTIIIDVFGYGQTLSRKVKAILPISAAVKDRIPSFIPREKIISLPLPVPRPPENLTSLGKNLRNKLGIKPSTIVFGRIGRPDDSIFDPIAINAYERMVRQENLDCLYLIVAPSKKMVEIVQKRGVPQVMFLAPIASNCDVWAFHGAIDVLAHFRIDGESLGVNIIESMAAGNPIITHKSRFWNAHLDYLDHDFARIAEIDSVEDYARQLSFFLKETTRDGIRSMGLKAREVYESKFAPEQYLTSFVEVIEKAIH
jgi:glycosyltransferase involved in cell wall biosynthesis